MSVVPVAGSDSGPGGPTSGPRTRPRTLLGLLPRSTDPANNITFVYVWLLVELRKVLRHFSNDLHVIAHKVRTCLK